MFQIDNGLEDKFDIFQIHFFIFFNMKAYYIERNIESIYLWTYQLTNLPWTWNVLVNIISCRDMLDPCN